MARASAQEAAAKRAEASAKAAAQHAAEQAKRSAKEAKEQQAKTRAAIKDFDKRLSAHKRTSKPKTTTKQEKETSSMRTPKQIAATKRMIRARKAQLASAGKPKKHPKKAAKPKKKANKVTFKSPFRVSVTRRKKNPSLPAVAMEVGSLLVGAAVGAAGIVGTGKLADRFKLSKNGQIAMLVAAGVIVGTAATMVSPFAGAASALPMFATAAGIATGQLGPRPEPVAALGGPRSGFNRGALQQMAGVRQIAGVVPIRPQVGSVIPDARLRQDRQIAAIISNARA